MNKVEIVRKIAKSLNVSPKTAKHRLDILLDEISMALRNHESIIFRGFGKFYIKTKPSKRFYNPKSKAFEYSASKDVVYFKPSTKLKEIVNKKSKSGDRPITIYDLVIKSPVINKLWENYVGKTEQSENNFIPSKNRKIIRKVQRKIDGLSGNIILPNELNKRKRYEKNRNISENSTLETIGFVLNNVDYQCETEAENYIYCAVPLNGTPILNFHTFTGITGGVTEPLLFHALTNELKSIEPSIKVLKDITLPIRNRNYGYKPDIAIVWKEKNLYIDVEIDEPYDLISRKPIHYKGCSDKLRNQYFLDNGWYVIRLSEEQIVYNLKESTNYILTNICTIVNDNRFDKNGTIDSVDRWAYDEAVKMEQEFYREKMLGLELSSQTDFCKSNNSEYTTYQNFDFVKPNDDIIEDRYETVRQEIRHLTEKFKYLIISSINGQYEYVIDRDNYSFILKENNYGLKLHDLIEEKEYFIPFKLIGNLRGTNDLFKSLPYDDIGKNIRDAMLCFNPIKIHYRNSSLKESWRTVVKLTPWYVDLYDETNKKKFPTESLLDIGTRDMYVTLAHTDKIGYFSGFCCQRQEIRTFNSTRILSISIYNCRKSGHFFSVGSMWDYLIEDLGEEAELLFNHLPSKYQKKLIFIGNLCNALVMQGKIDEAIVIYLSHEKNEVVYRGLKWHDVNLTDLSYFEEKSKNREYFTKTIKLLKSYGW